MINFSNEEEMKKYVLLKSGIIYAIKTIDGFIIDTNNSEFFNKIKNNDREVIFAGISYLKRDEKILLDNKLYILEEYHKNDDSMLEEI